MGTRKAFERKQGFYMNNYYADKLNSQSLFKVYDTAIPRISQYLAAEIDFVRRHLMPTDRVIEIAAGYGRIVRQLAPDCAEITGMDISAESIALAKDYLKDYPNAKMVEMDLHQMHFNEKFDVVLCLQNALSATRATPETIRNMISLLVPGGTAYFSTYSAKFWDWRIKWFEEQADKGCLGKLDYSKTKDGVIVCVDGFRATTQTPEDLDAIGKMIGLPYEVTEVDESSVFLIIHNNC